MSAMHKSLKRIPRYVHSHGTPNKENFSVKQVGKIGKVK